MTQVYGPIEEDEPTFFDCRMCGRVELDNYDGVHACPYGSDAMSLEEEHALLAVLKRWSDAKHWPGPSSGWAIDAFTFEGWTVAVFFDGGDWEDWDHVDHVVSPSGAKYHSWPQQGERGLPVSIAWWRPTQQLVAWLDSFARKVRDAVVRDYEGKKKS